MTIHDLDYCERRAREERLAVERSDTIEAATAHRMLAEEYERRAAELRTAREPAIPARESLAPS